VVGSTSYPILRTTPPFPSSFDHSGSAVRKCVAGVGLGPVRSGEFVIGGEVTGTRAGREAKIWWSPFHHALDMPPLVVEGRSLSAPPDSFRFESANVAFPGNPRDGPVPEAERRYFFPTGITIPRPGLWLLIATSGPNWGCFIHRTE
jgi:hypothetical protein